MKHKLRCWMLGVLIAGGADAARTQWVQTDSLPTTNVHAVAGLRDRLFVGTHEDGVYSSTDGAMNWRPANIGLTANDVPTFAVMNNNLFAGTAGGGVYRTTDEGANWNAVNTGLTSATVFRFVAVGDYLFAGPFGAGVCRSSDYGGSWTDVSDYLCTFRIRHFSRDIPADAESS